MRSFAQVPSKQNSLFQVSKSIPWQTPLRMASEQCVLIRNTIITSNPELGLPVRSAKDPLIRKLDEILRSRPFQTKLSISSFKIHSLANTAQDG
jgi:hypothetical protein